MSTYSVPTYVPLPVRMLRGLAALVAWGFLALTVVLAVVQIALAGQWSNYSTAIVGTHAGASVLSLLCVYRADRSGSGGAAVFSAVALLLCAAVLWTMWWA